MSSSLSRFGAARTRWVQELLTRAAALVGVDRGTIHIEIVSDRRMGQLHQQYSGVSGTTDVLTFDLRSDAQAPVEGDIAVCLDVAARQAARRGHPVQHEVLLYGVHGLLHLIGYDDHDPGDYQRMHEQEDRLLTALGIGRVYAGTDGRRQKKIA